LKIESDQFFKLSSSLLRGHSLKLYKPFASRRCRKEFFSLSVVDEWNCLPESVVTACSVDSFKVRLDQFMGQRRYEH